MMRAALAFLTVCSVTACAGDPPPRLGAYLGPALRSDATAIDARDRRLTGPVEAGLVVINDTTAPESAPALSTEMLNELVRVLRQRLAREIPGLTVTDELRPSGLTPRGTTAAFTELARANEMEYLLLAIFSSNEMESPAYLPLTGVVHDGGGGGRSVRPGYEVQSFARVELALLDGRSGRVLVDAEGRAWATLYRLDIPLETNTYPVVVRSLRNFPIYPEQDNAYDVLRGVATDDAVNQALSHLRLSWDERFPS